MWFRPQDVHYEVLERTDAAEAERVETARLVCVEAQRREADQKLYPDMQVRVNWPDNQNNNKTGTILNYNADKKKWYIQYNDGSGKGFFFSTRLITVEAIEAQRIEAECQPIEDERIEAEAEAVAACAQAQRDARELRNIETQLLGARNLLDLIDSDNEVAVTLLSQLIQNLNARKAELEIQQLAFVGDYSRL